ALLAYARALAVVASRFLISPDREHVRTFSFTWHDAFNMNQKVCLHSVHLERAAVLFNLGAVYSQIALAADLNTDIGIKSACGAFESAAGAFAESGLAAKAVAAGAITVDVTPECTGMLEKLMLGQAQECLLEKFIAGGKPPELCSKVARQVGIFYEEAYRALCAPPLSQHFDKTWISHIQMKAAQFHADACYRCSLDLHQAEEISEEIVRLQIGMNALADAKKTAKGVAAPLLHSVYKLESNMKTNLERAMKENNSMNLLQIPDVGSLGALPAACLVKSTSLAVALGASEQRPFSPLVPEGSMCDAEKLQQSSEISGVRLKEMDPSGVLPSLEGNVSLSVDLKAGGEAVQIRGSPSGLEAEMQLRDLNRVSEDLLVQTEEVLQKEACQDAQFWTQVGALSTDDYMCRLIQLASPLVPSSILDVPNDILLVIADLVRPPYQLERMRLVCKAWRNFLESRLGPYLVISCANPTHLDQVHLLQLPEAPAAAAAMVPMLARSFDPILPPVGTACWGSAQGLIAMVHGEPYERIIFLHCIHCGERMPLPPYAAEMIPRGIFFRAAALHDHLVISWVHQIDQPHLLNDAIDWNDIEAGN
ncbi:vacuolar-sorting protein BRO1-like, partial [Triticum urartu]